jgi:hypothetical protein
METLRVDRIAVVSAVRVGVGIFTGLYVALAALIVVGMLLLSLLGVIDNPFSGAAGWGIGIVLSVTAFAGAIYGGYVSVLAAFAYNIAAKISGGVKFDLTRSQDSVGESKKDKHLMPDAQFMEIVRIDLLSVLMTGATFLVGLMLFFMVFFYAGGLVQHWRKFTFLVTVGSISAMLFAVVYNALAGWLGGVPLAIDIDAPLDGYPVRPPVKLLVRKAPITGVLVITANILMLSWFIAWSLIVWELTSDPIVKHDLEDVASFLLHDYPLVSVIGFVALQAVIVITIGIYNLLAKWVGGLEMHGELTGSLSADDDLFEPDVDLFEEE